MGPLRAAECLPVVCAQNGVENERIALRRFQRVYGICVMLPATHLEPGRVDTQGSPHPGMLDIGRYPGGVDAVAEEVAIDLSAAGSCPWPAPKSCAGSTQNCCEIWGIRSRRSPATTWMRPAEQLVQELSSAVDAEGREVLTAAGIDFVGDEEWRAIGAIRCSSSRSRVASAAADRRGRAPAADGSIEADFLNGEIALLGRLHGVATPLNDLLPREANALVRDRRPPGSVSPAELLSKL